MGVLESYCHNCKEWNELVDMAHCSWCISYYREHGRLPRPGARLKTTLDRLWVVITDSGDSGLV